MHHHEKNVGIRRKLLVEQSEELERRFAIVHRQRAANSQHASLFSRLSGRLCRHSPLQSANTLAAMAVLRQTDCFLRGQLRSRSSRFYLLGESTSRGGKTRKR